MSNSNNDILYDRASDLVPYLTTGEAMDLNGSLEDLDSLYELIKRLEDKYLGSVQPDVTATVRASDEERQQYQEDGFNAQLADKWEGDDRYER